jgi:PadR family transcriptional regulator PadR
MEAIKPEQVKPEVPYGTLELLILRTLETMGALHGFGLARRIEQISESLVHLNQGSIYPALLRLQQKGWIDTEWGISENGRKAKFYSLTVEGRKQLQVEVENWQRTTALVAKFLDAESCLEAES